MAGGFSESILQDGREGDEQLHDNDSGHNVRRSRFVWHAVGAGPSGRERKHLHPSALSGEFGTEPESGFFVCAATPLLGQDLRARGLSQLRRWPLVALVHLCTTSAQLSDAHCTWLF